MSAIIENPKKAELKRSRDPEMVGFEFDPEEFAISPEAFDFDAEPLEGPKEELDEKGDLDVESPEEPEVAVEVTNEDPTGNTNPNKEDPNKTEEVVDEKGDLDGKPLEEPEVAVEVTNEDPTGNTNPNKEDPNKTEEKLKNKLDEMELEDPANEEEQDKDGQDKTEQDKDAQDKLYSVECCSLLIESDGKGKWNAQILAKQNDKIPVPEATQKGLESRENNVRTLDQLSIDMEQKTADNLQDRNSANMVQSAKNKADKPFVQEWNSVVKMPDGGFEVYPPNPDGKVDNSAKWVITPEQAAKHGIGDEGIDLVTKSPEELNNIVGLEKEAVRTHGIEAEKENSIHSMQHSDAGMDIGGR